MNTLGKKITTMVLSGAVLVGGVYSEIIVNGNSNVSYAQETTSEPTKIPILKENVDFVKKSESQYNCELVCYGSLSNEDYKKERKKEVESLKSLPERGISLSSSSCTYNFKKIFPQKMRTRGLYKFYFNDLNFEIIVQANGYQ